MKHGQAMSSSSSNAPVHNAPSLGADDLPTRALTAFFALAFGLTWGIGALAIFFTDQIEAVFGKIGYTNPLFILAVYSPALASLFLVWRYQGFGGLRRYLRRLALWRMPAMWWMLLIFGIPAAFYAGSVLKGNGFGAFMFSPWYAAIPALVTALLIGPVEELGWRGLALPLLQRALTPFWAGLLLGVIWAVWHLPAFLMSGTPQSAWSFTPFFAGVIALSVIMTPMFNAARGSLLVAALFHFQTNGPAWPDPQPWDSVIFALIAVAVVWLNRRVMFTRDQAITNVLLAPRQSGSVAVSKLDADSAKPLPVQTPAS
jgi:uncharacterized protein